ncbi:hypothetical protein BB560_005885 [Smittium megazygosporum]|uniref:PCI domain-containing protein n=1 Tax=Smittium megazygosporum TaxID=133381 RepID=A0A2T9YRX9_9FUNG|nr:hypothetical protein BB560_005885 [Smittium megazygosporum]
MDSNSKLDAIDAPSLKLAQLQSILLNGPENMAEGAKEKLHEAIVEDSLSFIYKQTCEKLGWKIDTEFLESMEAKNKKELEEFDEKMKAAEELGELELTNLTIKKAIYYAKIGDKANAIKIYEETCDKKSTTFNQKLDITFGLLHLAMFDMDTDLIQKQIQKAEELVDRGGDWERRNRLKAYQMVWHTYKRDFQKASKLFQECISTFATPELMPFSEFVQIGVIVCVLALERGPLKEKIINCPEVLEIIVEHPVLSTLLNSLYECKYSEFFKSLAATEQQYLKVNRYFLPHIRYYTREMRIKAYAQLLQSYRSLTLSSMAASFGVSEDFIDRELSRFVSNGRLFCVIDKVSGIVETNRPDQKNAQYQQTIKQGDLLLNRIQKLSRTINI